MAFAFVVCLLFVASVSTSPVGEAKCSWGPSYWCENYGQAVECNALEHCRTKVWAVKDEVACEVCEEIVPKIKDFMSRNATQTEVMALLEQACSEAGEFSQMCKSLVDQYEPVLMSNIEKLMEDPEQVCTALGLCASKEKNNVAAKLVLNSLPLKRLSLASKRTIIKSKPYSATPLCTLCEFAMSNLRNLLSENATQEEIEQALDDVCNMLPTTVRADCNQFVQQYAPAILQILVAELDPSVVCTALGLCASEEHRKALEKPVSLVVGSGEICEACDAVMTYMKNFLADNATKEEILSLMGQICNYLPSQIAPECSAIISEYGPAILDLIVNSDPHTLCLEMGLCNSTVLKKQDSDFCFLGASFWCANKINAVKCNAVKHCTDHVWK